MDEEIKVWHVHIFTKGLPFVEPTAYYFNTKKQLDELIRYERRCGNYIGANGPTTLIIKRDGIYEREKTERIVKTLPTKFFNRLGLEFRIVKKMEEIGK